MEIYNESVRDLLSTDISPLRLLDDPEVNVGAGLLCNWLRVILLYWSFTLGQKGTVVEKLTEETLRDWNHFKELLSICIGIDFPNVYLN